MPPDEVATLALPGPVRAAASDGTRVWCAAGGRLLAYEPNGAPLLEAPEPPGLLVLAAVPGVVVAILEPGIVAWLNPGTGGIQLRHPLGGELTAAAGANAVWALDRSSGRAWRLADAGALTEPIRLGNVDRIAPQGDRLWWTSRHDSLLRGGTQPVDLGADASGRGGMTVCAGSVWVSVRGALLRVGAWAAELGPPVAAPEGPVPHLACADGVLVGGSGHHGLFLLDPSIDADVRHLDVDLGGELDFLVVTRPIAWAIPAGRPEARLVTIRPPG
jgi:hypothetical protein